MCKMVLNNEHNGVELFFESKPEREIIESLKESGYHWHNKKKCWYAKQSQQTMQVANELTKNMKVTQNQPTEPIFAVSDVFIPPYSEVGSDPIFKTSDFEILDKRGGYFADENVYLHIYSNSIHMTNLSNALKTGKKCACYSLISKSRDGQLYCDLYNINKIKTFKTLIQSIKNETELQGFSVEKTEEKGIRTFSPFVEIKQIKIPNKWTKTHVWKAILAGQVYKGKTNYHYTDDYAYDYAYNYREGSRVNLISLAKDLIESSSDGWSIYPSENENDTLLIDVCEYSFDSKTLYFDEKCNLKEKEIRLEKEANELKKQNDDMLNQTLNLSPTDIIPNSAYIVEYLEKNGNTNALEKESKLMYSNELLSKIDDEMIKITSLSLFVPDSSTLYSISDFYHRPYGDDYNDKRIINMGNWENVVTGYALTELLSEGKTFATISESQHSTIESSVEWCQDFISGKASWVGCCETDYNQSLYKLNSEALRLQEDGLCLTNS